MTGGELRVACATARPDGLSLGDPTGTHVRLGTLAVEHHCGVGRSPLRTLAWDTVHGLTVDAPRSRWRRPGRAVAVTAMAAELVGLQWDAEIASVTVTATADTDDGRQDLELACDGYIGAGYWHKHLDALDAALHLLATHPRSRQAFTDPVRALTDIDAASRSRAPRVDLTQRWDANCTCAG